MSLRTVAALAMLIAHEASAEPELPQLTLTWISSGSQEALPTEIAGLYLTLHNSGNLSVRQASMTSDFVESLLRENGVVLGPYFPVELDAMLCDLNPDICSRSKVLVPDSALGDPAAHVGGYVPSPGHWTARSGDFLTIPDYVFVPVATLARIPAPKGWKAQDYVAPSDIDCSAWTMSCADLVFQFNPPQINAPEIGLSITVPQAQYQTSIPLRRDEMSALEKLINPSQTGSAVFGLKSFADVDPTYSGAWRDLITNQSPTDLTVQTLQPNLSPVGKVLPYGAAGEPLATEQKVLFELVNHPFAALAELDQELRTPVGVVVFETRLPAGHCDLPVMFRPDGTEIAPPVVASAVGSCLDVDDQAQSYADHAIAVAGIIASPENRKGIVGLNPAARLVMYEYDRDLPADQQIVALNEAMRDSFPTDVRVANLSLGVIPIISSGIREALAIQGSRVLVVAAAGNNGLHLTKDDCPILPACLNGLDNVITVVGLNSDLHNPGLWVSPTQSTNSSPNFDIGAPADRLLTTVGNNHFAHMAGTSFAAPQVSAAASLVFSAGETVFGDQLSGAQLSPKVVKDRLLYTADFFPELSGELFAGRLNIGRAINVADAQFILFDGRSVVGQVVEAPEEIVCRGPAQQQQFQNWWDIRRLVFNDVKGRHILFRHADQGGGSRYQPLERDASCLVATLSAPVRVLTRSGSVAREVKFQFGDIRDYTAPLFDQ